MKKALLLVVTIIVLASCDNKKDPFNWGNENIGLLNKNNLVKQLDSIFVNDSIVFAETDNLYDNGPGDIIIYDKKGTRLLTLTPFKKNDSLSKIEYVQIHDPRYKTDEGINITSSFGEVKEKYTVDRIDNMVGDAKVNIADKKFSFTVSKDQLSVELQDDFTTTIKTNQIPDHATGDYWIISW